LIGYGYQSFCQQVERLTLINTSDKCLRDLLIKLKFFDGRQDAGHTIEGGKEREG